MKPLFTTYLFCHFLFSVTAQVKVGISLEPGVSMITNDFEPMNGDVRTPPVLSGNAGGFAAYQFANGLGIQLGASYSLIRGVDVNTIHLTDQLGNKVGETEIRYHENISYFSIPLSVQYSFGEITVEGGFRYAIHLASNGRETGEFDYDGQHYVIDNYYDDINVSSYDYGPMVGAHYQLHDKFTLGLLYYHGLHKIMDVTPSPPWQRSIRELTVGLRYFILPSNAKQNSGS